MDEIIALFDFFEASASAPDATRGCLVSNVATERAASDTASHDYVMAHVAYIEQGLSRALRNAEARGELRADVSRRDQGRLLTTVVIGFTVLLRAGISSVCEVKRARRRPVDNALYSVPPQISFAVQVAFEYLPN